MTDKKEKSVIDVTEYRDSSDGELQGPNPPAWIGNRHEHLGQPSKNVVYRFRHHTGVNVAKAIALNEGTIQNCDDQLSCERFHRVLAVAGEKYSHHS